MRCWLESRRAWWRVSESSNTILSNFGCSRNNELEYLPIHKQDTYFDAETRMFVIQPDQNQSGSDSFSVH